MVRPFSWRSAIRRTGMGRQSDHAMLSAYRDITFEENECRVRHRRVAEVLATLGGRRQKTAIRR